MGGVTRQPMAGGQRNAPLFGWVDGKQSCIARAARLHFDKGNHIAAPRHNVDFAPLHAIAISENPPAFGAQINAGEKFRLNAKAARGAPALLLIEGRAQPSPPSTSDASTMARA